MLVLGAVCFVIAAFMYHAIAGFAVAGAELWAAVFYLAPESPAEEEGDGSRPNS